MRRSGVSDARAPGHTRPPVLVLTGIGLTAGVAQRLIGELEAHFEVLTAPGTSGAATAARGTAGAATADRGASAPLTLEAALAALDATGADQAHVIGLSFGGAVAQQLAIEHPHRIRSLVLASSTAGGELYVPPEHGVRDFLGRLDELPAEEGLWASVPYLYAAATWRRRARVIGEDIAARLKQPLNPRAYRRQQAIARAHDAAPRLSGITAPTLVVHGQQDRVLPVDNGRGLAAGIAGARFMRLKGGAHAFPTDVPDATAELVSFLIEHSRRRPGSAPSPRTGRVTRA
jgi:pimeloyl-ACP methyl ester carboxylesterase